MENQHHPKGLRHIRTLQKVKKRAMPSDKSALNLEIYLLKREQNRIITETKRIQDQLQVKLNQLRSIEEAIIQVEEKIGIQSKAAQKNNEQQQHSWQTQVINY
ncbi:MAG: hypothetical protein ACPGJS_13320 [Flammeovirgaceae bacterium]